MLPGDPHSTATANAVNLLSCLCSLLYMTGEKVGLVRPATHTSVSVLNYG